MDLAGFGITLLSAIVFVAFFHIFLDCRSEDCTFHNVLDMAKLYINNNLQYIALLHLYAFQLDIDRYTITLHSIYFVSYSPLLVVDYSFLRGSFSLRFGLRLDTQRNHEAGIGLTPYFCQTF